VSLRALAAGKETTLALGAGKPGRTMWNGELTYVAGGKSWHHELHFDTVVSPSLKVNYDLGHLNLEQHYLEVQLSQPAGRAELSVLGEDGTETGTARVSFHGEAPGTWLHIPWTVTRNGQGPVLKLDLKIYDRAGFPVHLQLVPWSVSVPHDEVNFPTASYEILPSERGKLDESYLRIGEILARVKGKIEARLFVDGHTDTVGSDADNLVLSRNRARAIAGYFAKKGISVPILYAGSGERVLRVQTEDNVDEPRNRRADYVLAADPPRLPAGTSWQKLE
jgi:outer membrane protein OmpA-like peptidoglycan-associated protein